MLSLFEVTRAAFDATSKLLHAQLRGVGDQGDGASAEPVDDAAVLSQLGVAVRPVIANTLRALGYQDGDEVWVLKLWDKARTPTDLDAGETRVFAAGAVATALRLLADRIDVNATRINLGGAATKKVNREGDSILPGTFTVACTTSTITLTYNSGAPGSTPTAVNIGVVGAAFAALPAPVVITLGGVTGPGSNKVRAED